MIVGVAVAAPAQAAGVSIRRVSVSATGGQTDRATDTPVISDNGRYIAFASAATNLVPGDTNNEPDIFVTDRVTGAVKRVNVSSSGAQAHHLDYEGSFGPSISGDGRYIAFASFADNLVPGDTNASLDGFVHDQRTGRTFRVTLNAAGEQAAGGGVSIDDSGRFVSFISSPSRMIPGSDDNFDAVYHRDLRTGAVNRVDLSTAGDKPDSISGVARISGDGRHVVFQSWGAGLDPRDTNTEPDVFLHNRATGVTELVSVTSAGVSGNGASMGFAVSADGRYVSFTSYASDLLPGDTNEVPDDFVRDLRTGVTRLVSVAADGGPSDHGGNGASSISDDGRYVGFSSSSTNLVPGDLNGASDTFIRDLRTGTTRLVSVNRRGVQGDAGSGAPTTTGDARWLAFASDAGNLVPGDTNGLRDVFVRRAT